MTNQTRIAIVEDDPEIRELVAGMLTRAGFEAVPAADGSALDRQLARQRIDLILLDLMLPGEDGLAICRRLRAAQIDVPIIMVTARGDEIDRIVGLEIGADDYVPKPFNPHELLARLRAVLRRTRHPGVPGPNATRARYAFAGWSLDPASCTLTDPEGRNVNLTGGEVGLLQAFVTPPQRVLNRDQLLDWTRGRDAGPLDRTIDVQLSRLRRKLGDDPREPAMIRTIRGGGYLFAPAVEQKIG